MDCVTNTWSIEDLYNENRAFNLVGGSQGEIAGGNSGPVSCDIEYEVGWRSDCLLTQSMVSPGEDGDWGDWGSWLATSEWNGAPWACLRMRTRCSGGGGSSGDSLWTQQGSDIHYAAGSVGIGTTEPESALDVRGGQIQNEGFPAKLFLGYAQQTAALQTQGANWTDIPGASITVTLPREMTLLLEANGSATVVAGTSNQNTHCGFRFVINGTPEGDGNWGDVIAGVSSASESTSHGWWTPWQMNRLKTLPSDTYTIKLQQTGWTSTDSSCSTVDAEYSAARLKVEGW